MDLQLPDTVNTDEKHGICDCFILLLESRLFVDTRKINEISSSRLPRSQQVLIQRYLA
jgi:hypothetical protein